MRIGEPTADVFSPFELENNFTFVMVNKYTIVLGALRYVVSVVLIASYGFCFYG